MEEECSWCASYSSALHFKDKSSATSSLERLLEDCAQCATSSQASGSYSSGHTFSISPLDEPRCTLERLALEIFAHHTAALRLAGSEVDLSQSCAEWWTQHIDCRDDIGFHWDRDYGLEERGIMRYPSLATVTYLSGKGGPTVVANLAGDQEDERGARRLKRFLELVVSQLRPMKHLVFRGNLLHGAPSSLFEEVEEEEEEGVVEGEDSGSEDSEEGVKEARVTFLVNIWVNHLPQQPRRVPRRLLKSLSSLSSDDVCMRFTERSLLERVSLLERGSNNNSTMKPSRYSSQVMEDAGALQLDFGIPSEEMLTSLFTSRVDMVLVCAVDGSVAGEAESTAGDGEHEQRTAVLRIPPEEKCLGKRRLRS